MANVLTPASGLKVGDKNGAMEVVQIGTSNHSAKINVDWKLTNGHIYTETVTSDTPYMVQRNK